MPHKNIAFVGNKRCCSFLVDVQFIARFVFLFRCCIFNYPVQLNSLKCVCVGGGGGRARGEEEEGQNLHIVLMN